MKYSKTKLHLPGPHFNALVQQSDAFICAAGFERRAQVIPLAAPVPRNPVVIAFKNGPSENNKTYKLFEQKFEKVPGFAVCEIDLLQLDKFDDEFSNILKELRKTPIRQVIFDVSGMPNFAICVALAAFRGLLPTTRVFVLHTEAEDYFPQMKHFEQIKRGSKKRGMHYEYLSDKAVSMHIPGRFTGVTLGHNDTCLIVFPGYEPHRTACVLEAMNPSKLVMAYGLPKRKDLEWRLELSKLMHQGLDDYTTRSEEEVSTSEVSAALRLILSYYEHLYDDHCLSLCPLNSKMQAVASFLAWETYPDIQISFPVPTEYLARRFSIDHRDSFVVDLGMSPVAEKYFGGSQSGLTLPVLGGTKTPVL